MRPSTQVLSATFIVFNNDAFYLHFMENNDQRNFSEQLQLLHELQYFDTPHQFQRNNRRSRDTNREMRLLDTITVALSTGNPGEVFAAAFDKRKKVELVLAKNGHPTPDDIAAAEELISLIGSPAVSDAMDLFPFLMHRGGANLNKWIHNLHTSIQDGELCNDFTLALETYEPADITSEFPHAGAILRQRYGDAVPPFLTVWGNFVEEIAQITAQGLNAGDISTSAVKFRRILRVANALSHSRFLKTLVEVNLWSAEKLKRRLDRVRHITISISHLVKQGKRLFPITHRWVMDTFTGTGERVFDLCNDPYNAISRRLYLPLSPENMDRLDKKFPSIRSNWQRHKTVHTCIHAELRVILHLGLPLEIGSPVRPIGLNKRCCICCSLWIEKHNGMFGTSWKTSRFRGKPHANWALPGAACSCDGTGSVDEAVVQAISMRLTNALDWNFPLVSSEDESGSDTELFQIGVGPGLSSLEISCQTPCCRWCRWGSSLIG